MDPTRLWLWLACSSAGCALYLLIRAERVRRKPLLTAGWIILVIAGAAVAVDVLQPLSSRLVMLTWIASASAAVGGLVVLLVPESLAWRSLGSGIALAGVSGLLSFTGAWEMSLLLLAGLPVIAAFWFRTRRSPVSPDDAPPLGGDRSSTEPGLASLMWVLLTAGLLSAFTDSTGSADKSGLPLLSNQLAAGAVLFTTGLLVFLATEHMFRQGAGVAASQLGLLVMLLAWSREHGDDGAMGLSVLAVALLALQLSLMWSFERQPRANELRQAVAFEKATNER